MILFSDYILRTYKLLPCHIKNKSIFLCYREPIKEAPAHGTRVDAVSEDRAARQTND